MTPCGCAGTEDAVGMPAGWCMQNSLPLWTSPLPPGCSTHAWLPAQTVHGTSCWCRIPASCTLCWAQPYCSQQHQTSAPNPARLSPSEIFSVWEGIIRPWVLSSLATKQPVAFNFLVPDVAAVARTLIKGHRITTLVLSHELKHVKTLVKTRYNKRGCKNHIHDFPAFIFTWTCVSVKEQIRQSGFRLGCRHTYA